MPAAEDDENKKDLEQDILENTMMAGSPATGQREADDGQAGTYIVESTDNVEFYFVWPIPLVFDEFTPD
jgi:hypothetical protein